MPLPRGDSGRGDLKPIDDNELRAKIAEAGLFENPALDPKQQEYEQQFEKNKGLMPREIRDRQNGLQGRAELLQMELAVGRRDGRPLDAEKLRQLMDLQREILFIEAQDITGRGDTRQQRQEKFETFQTQHAVIDHYSYIVGNGLEADTLSDTDEKLARYRKREAGGYADLLQTRRDNYLKGKEIVQQMLDGFERAYQAGPDSVQILDSRIKKGLERIQEALTFDKKTLESAGAPMWDTNAGHAIKLGKAKAREEAQILAALALNLATYRSDKRGLQIMKTLGYKPKEGERRAAVEYWNDSETAGIIDSEKLKELQQALAEL